MPSFPVLRTRLPVCFLSPFPDSLPQLFLRCFPYAFAFGLFPFDRFSYQSPLFRFWLLSLCFFLSSFFPSPPHSGFPGAPFLLSLLWLFPVLSNLVSRVFFPGSSYWAFCSFPFILPGFAPTAVPPVLPLCFRFRAFPSPSAFFRPLLLGSDYSAFRFFFSLLPVSASQWLPRCCLSPFRLPCSPSLVRPVSMPFFRFRYSAYCNSFLRLLSRLTVATSASWPSSFRFPASSPLLSL